MIQNTSNTKLPFTPQEFNEHFRIWSGLVHRITDAVEYYIDDMNIFGRNASLWISQDFQTVQLIPASSLCGLNGYGISSLVSRRTRKPEPNLRRIRELADKLTHGERFDF